MYVSTLITVAIGGGLAFKGYAAVWPIFGSANQLLAALALLAIGIWMKKSGRRYKMTIYPMIFMFAVTLTALVFVMRDNFGDILFFIAAALFILAFFLMKMAYTEFSNTEFVEGKESKEA
jgi:carbon starvation protein